MPTLLIMCCRLVDKVGRILRECGLPWTAVRMRYVRLYCVKCHLEGRPCARMRDVRDCLMVIVEDYMNAIGVGQPTWKFVNQLGQLERDIVSNVSASPFSSHRFV
jgi:hypothetical protein